jgi:hypothetical protein
VGECDMVSFFMAGTLAFFPYDRSLWPSYISNSGIGSFFFFTCSPWTENKIIKLQKIVGECNIFFIKTKKLGHSTQQKIFV